MQRYDPDIAPDSKQWLAADEGERLIEARKYHRVNKIDLPDIELHAIVHVVIENQIAESLDSVVRAMARLQKQGLSRHDAIHAVGCIFADHFLGEMPFGDEMTTAQRQARYEAAIDRLTKKSWLKQYG